MGKHEYSSPVKVHHNNNIPLEQHKIQKRWRNNEEVNYCSDVNRRMSTDSTQNDPEPLTLLQKSEMFRRMNSKKWRAGEKLKRLRSQEMKGNIQVDPFIQEYNAKVKEDLKKCKEQQCLKKKEPRKLIARIEFLKSDYEGSDSSSLWSRMSTSSDSSSTSETQSALELRNNLEEDDRDIDSYELHVFVSTGINMYNGVEKDEDRMQKCRVKIYVFPDQEKRQTKQKSSYRYLTHVGVTKWEHEFVLKGLSTKLLRNRYIVIEVTGENSTKKMSMGQTILAGDQAKIKSETQIRAPTSHETRPLMEAIRNPETSISVTLDLDTEDYVSFSSFFHGKHLPKAILRRGSIRRHSGKKR